MKDIPLSVANGALFFFVILATELQIAIQKSTKEVQKKAEVQATTFKNGDGTLQ